MWWTRHCSFDYQWHVEYPIEISSGTSRSAAAGAAGHHWRQATGFAACRRRYGDSAPADSFTPQASHTAEAGGAG